MREGRSGHKVESLRNPGVHRIFASPQLVMTQSGFTVSIDNDCPFVKEVSRVWSISNAISAHVGQAQ